MVMLQGQNGGWDQEGALFAVGYALESRAQGNFCLAKAHITAKQPVHGVGFFHISFNFTGATQLVLRFFKLKAQFKIVLHVNVGRKGMAFDGLAFGIKDNKLLGHVPHGGLDLCAGALPVLAA